MTIYKSFQDAGESIAGKIVVCKRAHSEASENSKTYENFGIGDIFYVIDHKKNVPVVANRWQYPALAYITILKNGTGFTFRITSANSFHENWGLLDPKDIFKEAGIVFTGALSLTREYYQKLVELFGGDFQNSITKKTKYLVMADKHSQSSKAQKARAQGVTLISEQDFLDLIRNA